MNYIFAVGLKARYDQLCEDLNLLVPVTNPSELRWYAVYRFSRGWDAGTLTILRQAFAENTATMFDVSTGSHNLLSTALKLEVFDKIERVGDWPFYELVGCLIWLANQSRPDIENAVKAVARYANQPREVRWEIAIGFLEHVFPTSNFGITFQKSSVCRC